MMAVDWNIVGIAAGTAFCGMLAVLFFGRPLLRAASEIRSLPRMVQGALAALALVATLNAQKLRSGGGGMPDPPAAVTQEDVARGYRLVAETNETGHSFAMPSNAVYVGRLHEHGARSDFGMHMVDFGAWAFPCGTNGGLRSRLWWFMDGRLQDAPRNPGFAASAGLGDTLAVQGESRLWILADGDERTVTWERFFACGDTNREANAQISLRGDGGFTVRSNDLVRIYRRVNPDDWDDDGIPNEEDIYPLAYDGDNFGPHQELPPGANSNAYCWVDVVVLNANALVTFTGDGASELPDPTFIAKAGETNRVAILIGKTYQVTSRLPISCVDQSSGEIEVDQISPSELQIVWPVTIEVESEELRMESGIGNSPLSTLQSTLPTPYSLLSTLNSQFAMSVWPDCLGGGFTWTNSCCSISSSGGVFTYACSDACHCGGCFAIGYYGYEGYSLPAYGGWCGCAGAYDSSPEQGDDDGPHGAGASATFSKSAVIFEDGYWNTPTNWIERHSTQAELHCVAHGGPNGGHVRFEISGENKLERVFGHLLPVEQDVSPGNKLDFTIVYRGQLPSTNAEDIVVTTTFAENVQGATQEVTTATLTSVRIEVEPTSYREDSPNRHVMGVRERFMIHRMPQNANISINVASGWLYSSGYQTSIYACPLSAGSNGIEILSSDGARHVPNITVVEPQGIVCEGGESACRDGVIAMKLYPYILPLDVSFSGISMMEVPSLDGGPSGYFTNTMFSAFWHHTTNRAAGVWHHPTNENFFFYDTPSFDLYCPSPLSHGTITWVIPLGWGEIGATALYDVFDTVAAVYQQVFTLDESGGLRIDKFGQWIKVSAEGYITHSPGIHDQ